VQGSLLDAMIREGIRDGKQQLCVMRTALAVTEGYLANRDTVMSGLSSNGESTMRRSQTRRGDRDFLQLRRRLFERGPWGGKALDEAYRRAKMHEREREWIPNFFEAHRNDLNDDTVRTLRALASPSAAAIRSSAEQDVVRQLAARYLKRKETYLLNPAALSTAFSAIPWLRSAVSSWPISFRGKLS
jgi:hypothetical protein